MKKFLSLVLAVVMTASLVTISAGAKKTFDDSSSITYKEAVDVIGTLDIVDGYQDSTFKPEAELTRGAAAKIICNMVLGPTQAKALPTSVAPFPDVPAGSTFAGYIAYCSEQNIISGYSDGTFRPAGNLTGYAFMKMLLGALGYDQNIEGYVGGNWAVNVAKQCIGIGLDAGLKDTFNGAKTVNRQEAALYAFNTLQADLVEYGEKSSTIEVNGAVITFGGSKFKSMQWQSSATRRNNIKADAYVQFAEQYFNKLVRLDTTDGFGRPATKWTWKGEKIGTYASTADVTYAKNVKLREIYNDLEMASSTSDTELYVNGLLAASNFSISKSQDVKLTKVGNLVDVNTYYSGVDNTTQIPLVSFIGKGTTVEVFHDTDDNSVVICAISLYGGKISELKAASKGKEDRVVVEYSEYRAPYGINEGTNDEFETTSFEEEDVVGYTYSFKDEGIASLVKLSSVTGSLTEAETYIEAPTSDNFDGSLTLDGKEYGYAKEIAFEDTLVDNFDAKVGDMTLKLDNKEDLVVYLDPNGNALWVEDAEFSADAYALIERISVEDKTGSTVYRDSLSALTTVSMWDSNRVRLLFSDGTEKNLDLDSNKYLNAAGTGIASEFMAGRIVRYKTNSNGTVKLLKLADTKQTATTNLTIDSKAIKNTDWDNGKTIGADSRTIFVVKKNGEYKVYTGVKNAPKVDGDGEAYVYYSGNTAKVMFIINGTVKSSSKDVVFIAAYSGSGKGVAFSDGNDYYRYSAVVNGEITTVKVDAGATGLIKQVAAVDVNDHNYSVVINDYETDDGRITVGNFDDDGGDLIYMPGLPKGDGKSGFFTGVKKVSGSSDEIKLRDGDEYSTYNVARNAQIYIVDADGVINEAKLSDVKASSDSLAIALQEDGEITYLFVMVY